MGRSSSLTAMSLGIASNQSHFQRLNPGQPVHKIGVKHYCSIVAFRWKRLDFYAPKKHMHTYIPCTTNFLKWAFLFITKDSVSHLAFGKPFERNDLQFRKIAMCTGMCIITELLRLVKNCLKIGQWWNMPFHYHKAIEVMTVWCGCMT